MVQLLGPPGVRYPPEMPDVRMTFLCLHAAYYTPGAHVTPVANRAPEGFSLIL